MSLSNNDRDADGHRVFREPERTYMRTPAGSTVEVERLPGRPPTVDIRCAGERWTYRVKDDVAHLVDGTYQEPPWIDPVLRQLNVRERGPPIEHDAEEETE